MVIAEAFRREARSSDSVARIGNARFAALLPETDEIRAINYGERVRLVCDRGRVRRPFRFAWQSAGSAPRPRT